MHFLGRLVLLSVPNLLVRTNIYLNSLRVLFERFVELNKLCIYENVC